MPLRDSSAAVASDDKGAVLRSELAGLQKQQWKTLEHATYVGMTAEQAREYEQRARRIVELQRTLNIQLDPPPSPW